MLNITLILQDLILLHTHTRMHRKRERGCSSLMCPPRVLPCDIGGDFEILIGQEVLTARPVLSAPISWSLSHAHRTRMHTYTTPCDTTPDRENTCMHTGDRDRASVLKVLRHNVTIELPAKREPNVSECGVWAGPGIPTFAWVQHGCRVHTNNEFSLWWDVHEDV